MSPQGPRVPRGFLKKSLPILSSPAISRNFAQIHATEFQLEILLISQSLKYKFYFSRLAIQHPEPSSLGLSNENILGDIPPPLPPLKPEWRTQLRLAEQVS